MMISNATSSSASIWTNGITDLQALLVAGIWDGGAGFSILTFQKIAHFYRYASLFFVESIFSTKSALEYSCFNGAKTRESVAYLYF